MDMTQLLSFTTIAKYNSVTKAAEQLHVSQPAMSAMLKKFEAEVGVALFERTANRILLNAAGEIALMYAESILRNVEQMKADVRQTADTKHLAVAFCDPGIQWYCVPAFSAACPDIVIQPFLYQDGDEVKLLKRRMYDVVVSPAAICCADIVTKPFLEDRVYISAASDSPEGQADSISLRQLRGQPFLISNIGGYFLKTIERIISQENPKVTLIKNDWMITQQLIRTTNIAATSSTMAVATKLRDDGAHRVLVPVSDRELHITYYINYLKEHRQPVRAFVGWAAQRREEQQRET